MTYVQSLTVFISVVKTYSVHYLPEVSDMYNTADRRLETGFVQNSGSTCSLNI